MEEVSFGGETVSTGSVDHVRHAGDVQHLVKKLGKTQTPTSTSNPSLSPPKQRQATLAPSPPIRGAGDNQLGWAARFDRTARG